MAVIRIGDNAPDVNPSLLLDFAKSKNLDQRITFTRSSAATYWDGHSTVKAEENLLSYSNVNSWAEFSNVTKTDVNVTDPYGTSKAVEATYTGSGFIFRQQYLQPGTYTASVWAKSGTMSRFMISMYRNTSPTYFQLSPINTTTTWARYEYTFTTTVGSIFNFELQRASGTSDTGTMYFAFAQIEERDHASLYVETTGVPKNKYQPLMKVAPANVPRFNHIPLTGESLGLLMEEGRTRSNAQEYAAAYQSSIVANEGIAPDGSNTAIGFYPNNSGVNGSTIILDSGSVTAGVTVCHSVFIKPTDTNFNLIGLYDNTHNKTAIFDLSGNNGNGEKTGGAHDAAGIEHIGNNWYRIWFSYYPTSSTCYIQIYNQDTDVGGLGTNGYLVWGYNKVIGEVYPSSYIHVPSATRSADDADISGKEFSSFYKQEGFTVYAEGRVHGHATYQGGVSLNNGGAAERIIFGFKQANDGASLNVRGLNNNTIAYLTESTGWGWNTELRLAGAIEPYNFGFSFNGSTTSTNTSGVITPLQVDRLTLGGSADNTERLTGHISKVAFYPKRLSDDTLNFMTEV